MKAFTTNKLNSDEFDYKHAYHFFVKESIEVKIVNDIKIISDAIEDPIKFFNDIIQKFTKSGIKLNKKNCDEVKAKLEEKSDLLSRDEIEELLNIDDLISQSSKSKKLTKEQIDDLLKF
ncbi:hypothetical protein ACFL35_19525 [Candidatus Riflebacteria bacterium]